MEGKANIMKSNCDDTDKETVTLSYTVKECGTMEVAEELKDKLDAIIDAAGGDVHESGRTK